MFIVPKCIDVSHYIKDSLYFKKNVGKLLIIKEYLIVSKKTLDFLSIKNKDFAHADTIMLLKFKNELDFYQSIFKETIEVFNPILSTDNTLRCRIIDHIFCSKAIFSYLDKKNIEALYESYDILIKEINRVNDLIEEVEYYRHETKNRSEKLGMFTELCQF